VRLSIMLEPQEGLTYDDQLAVARRVEATGLHGLYRSDHYATVTGGEATASTDAWAVLAGLARETSRIRLGTLVSPATFRPAGNLAKVVATVAEMAGAAPDGGPRIHLGMGTGWLEAEHRQYGFPFEDRRTRFARLEEHLAAVSGLWDPDQDPYSQRGEHVVLEEARFRPKPDPRPRLIVGGSGMERTPMLAARYADELNGVSLSPERAVAQRIALGRACEAIGRDPDTAAYSLMTGLLVGADDKELEARTRRLQELQGDSRPVDAFLADLRATWVVGTVEEAADHLGHLAQGGVATVMLQNLLYDDLDVVDLVAEELAPRV
jgi:alkanesulfonate monooxygenase SsuD/methylene tetrahydromethanopterin reductase-like flavin-dependent oxidoreductase (luciferase family)